MSWTRWMALAPAFLLILTPCAAAQTAPLDLLQRATDPNPTLKTYTATANLSATLHVVIPVHEYEQLTSQFAVTPLSDDGSYSSYLLVPKKTDSRVKNVTVRVNDTSSLVDRAEWAYTNGTLRFIPAYADVGSFHLTAKADIAARFPGYSVDGTLTFANYVPNAPVSPSVFASPAH